MVVLEENDPELFERVQERNLIRQYDLLTNCIEIGLKQGPSALDKYTIWALNHVAVANISQFGGRFREEPIYLEHHIPPHFREVPELMDRFLSTIHENWFLWSPTELAAYGLWRLNWIHPFIEGNGRGKGSLLLSPLCAHRKFVARSENCLSAYAMIGNPIIRHLKNATLHGKLENLICPPWKTF
jgi:Fic/DOC family